MLDAGRIGRVTSVTGYKASCLAELFSGRAGYGIVDVGGFPVEAEVETWARADAGGGYLYGQLSHLLGLGLWLVPGGAGGGVRARELPARTAAISTCRSPCGSPTA